MNAPGELRPTGTEPGTAKKPALWAVSSSGLLGAGVSTTRRFSARLFPLGHDPAAPLPARTALPRACQRCWPLSLVSSSSRPLTWLSRVAILLFSAPTFTNTSFSAVR